MRMSLLLLKKEGGSCNIWNPSESKTTYEVLHVDDIDDLQAFVYWQQRLKQSDRQRLCSDNLKSSNVPIWTYFSTCEGEN